MISCLTAFLFLAAAVWFFVSLVTGNWPAPRRQSPLERLASRMGGRLERGGWSRAPSVRFAYNDALVRVSYGTRRDGAYCVAEFDCRTSPVRLVVAPNSRSVARSALRGLRRLESASDPFFWRYRAHSNHSAEATKLLGDGVKWQIEQLRAALGQKDIELHVAPGQIIIRKFFWPRDIGQLEQFTQLALKLYDQLMLVRAEGIEFVAPAEATPIEDVCCQVCGESITSDMVFCRRCRTPHHRECWEYTGSCCVFGCQETQYVTPRVKQPDA